MLVTAVLSLSLLLSASPSEAAGARQLMPACDASRPSVDLLVRGFDSNEQRAAAAQLNTLFRVRNLQVCPSPGAGEHLGRVVIGAGAAGDSQITIEVSDALTHKRVIRAIDVAGVAADARALTVAVAAEELLLASWAELGLLQGAAAAAEAPAQVRQAVVDETDSWSRRLALRAGVTALAFRKWLGVGSELHVDWKLLDSITTGVRLAWHHGLPRSSAHGEAESELLTVGLDAALHLGQPSSPVTMSFLLRVDSGWLGFFPEASPSGIGSRQSAIVALPAVGARATLRPLRWLSFVFEASAIYVGVGARATDAGKTVAAVAGPGGQMILALELTP